MSEALWVYAIGTDFDAAALNGTDGVGGSTSFEVVATSQLGGMVTRVDATAFSQDALDAHGRDLEWLGAIGLAHQRVNERLSTSFRSLPLRAFTLFSSEERLRAYLEENAQELRATLNAIDGRSEWTIRIDLDAERWNEALLHRVDELRNIQSEIEGATSGRAYLLKKKLEESKKSAARKAEEDLVREVADTLEQRLGATLEVETRERRNGSFPQVNLLLAEAEAPQLRLIERELNDHYESDGVRLTVTGPWPPYSFAAKVTHG